MRGRLLLIFLLGGGGALARYFVAGWAQRSAVFPFGTLAVNVLGCLLFGLIYAAAQERFLLSSQARAVLLIGFVGAFTTFSTFIFETLAMIQDRDYLAALAYWGLNQALGFAFLILGMAFFKVL